MVDPKDLQALRRAIESNDVDEGQSYEALQTHYDDLVETEGDESRAERIKKCRDIRDRSIAQIIGRWKVFQSRMAAANNPGLEPLFSGEMTPAWREATFLQRRRSAKDLGWVVYRDEHTIPLLLRPDGRVGGLNKEPIEVHLLKDAHFRAWDEDDYGDDDDDCIEDGDVRCVEKVMPRFVKYWTVEFARILRKENVEL
jgi:hypothetical protein